MFQEVFGLEVGADDDFFDLEGDSFMAANLMVMIQDRFGIELSLSTLLEAPTPRALARIVATGGNRRASLLLRLGDKGPPPAVVCVHGNVGETSFALHLARAFPGDRPVFGVRAAGLERGELPARSLEAMVGSYITELRKTAPGVPYAVVGTCAGAVIAYEMAARLHALGDPTRLILIDPDTSREWAPYLYRSGLALSLFQSSWRHRAAGIEEYHRSGSSDDPIERSSKTANAIKRAVASFVPRPFDQPSLLVTTVERDEILLDSRRGFPAYLTDLGVESLPYTHESIFTDGIVDVAEAVDRFLVETS